MLLSLVSSAFADPDASAHILTSGRASVAFPATYTESPVTVSAEIAGEMKDHNALGVRFIYQPNPPDIYGRDTPNLAFGPVFTWAYYSPLGEHFDIYPTGGVGFALGKSPSDGTNQILPFLQAGFGVRGHVKSGENEITIAPEMGFVPLVLAPYMGISVGGRFASF